MEQPKPVIPAVSSAPQPPADPGNLSVARILAPLVALILGTFMAVLDNTVVNVALPTLEQVFHADLHVLQWVIAGYSLAQASVVPLSGWLSDRFGAKRLYLIALAIFTAGSAVCALAPGAGALTALRVVQGLGGGMLMPVGMALVYRLSPPERRGAVMGTFGVPVLMAPALGPILSGSIIQFADWRLIFLINLPVGILAIWLGYRHLPELPFGKTHGQLDLPGVILGPIAFAALTYGIGMGTALGWGSPLVLGILAGGATVLAAFVLRELSATQPLLALRVFSQGAFTRGILTQWVVVGAMFGTLFLIPVFLQQVLGYGAFETGLATLPQALAAATFMPIGGRIFDRWGVRPTATIGLLSLTTGLWLLSRITVSTTVLSLIVPLICCGAGMGLSMMPLNTYLLNCAPHHLAGRVTSLSGAFQRVMTSMAVATSVTILQARLLAHAATATKGSVGGALAFGDVYQAASVLAGLGVILAITLVSFDSNEAAPLGDPSP